MVVTQFGKTVALDSNTLAVSAPGDYGTSQGSCTSGYWVGWHYICTAYANSNKGAVYVFTRSGSTWSLEDELSSTDHSDNTDLTASTLEGGDYFGHSLSLDNNTLAVGAYGDDGSSSNQQYGATYIFTRSSSTWSLEDEISSPDHSDNTGFGGNTLKNSDYFGHSVALDGDNLMVGSPHDDGDSGGNTGAAYVFDRDSSTWSLKRNWSTSQPGAY